MVTEMLTDPRTIFATREDFDKAMPIEDRERFWKLVEMTITQVFDGKPQTADNYRRQIEGGSDDRWPRDGGRAPSLGEWIAVYHASPLSIAADLSGWRKPVPKNMLHQFLRLQREILKEDGIDVPLPPTDD
jgi:hypothetical protein